MRAGGRGPTARGLRVLALAVTGGVAVLALDGGWVLWCVCLGLAALAILLAAPAVADRRRGVAHAAVWAGALLAGAVVVLAGVVAVRQPPLSAPGWDAPPGAAVVAGPTVVSVHGGTVTGRALSDGRRRWRRAAPGFTGVVPVDGRVLLTGYRRLASLDPATGRLRWQARVGGRPRAWWLDTVVLDEPAQGVDLDSGRTVWRRPRVEEAGVVDAGADFADPLRDGLGVAADSAVVLGYARGQGYSVLSSADGRSVRRLRETPTHDGPLLTVRSTLVTARQAGDGALRVHGLFLGNGERWSADAGGAEGEDVGRLGDKIRVLSKREADERPFAQLLDPRTGDSWGTVPVPAGWRLDRPVSPVVVGDPRQLPVSDGHGRHAVWDSGSGRLALEDAATLEREGSYTDGWTAWCRTVHDAVGGEHVRIDAVGPNARAVGPVYADRCAASLAPAVGDGPSALLAGGRLLRLPSVSSFY